jgi:hypothetical protein
MPGLNFFKRNSDKPRVSIRERFRNAAARVLPRSTRSHAGGGTDTARRALMAGSLASAAVASLPATASAGGDAILIEAWAKYQVAMDEFKAMSWRMKPAVDAALASLPPHPFEMALAAGKHPAGTTFQAISAEEHAAYEEERHEHYVSAFDSHGVTVAQQEQDHFWDTVLEPLIATIRNTTPTTLEGAAIKARYLLEHSHASILTTDAMSRLDVGEEALRQFIEQLAALK